MKLSDFILLKEDGKRGMVLHAGVLLAKRSCEGCCVFLFLLDNLYVEVYCRLADRAVKEYRTYRGWTNYPPALTAYRWTACFSNVL